MTETQPERKRISLKERLDLSSRNIRGLAEDERNSLIERESRALMAEGIALTSRALHDSGETALLSAIYRYFPKGLIGLQTRLKIQTKSRHPKGYWKDPEKIESEARSVIAEHSDISADLLKKIGRSDLLGAVTKNYPGGLFALKDRLQVQRRKPRGYYTVEQIEADAKAFLNEHGSLHPKVMRDNGYSSLSAKISQYPGGMRSLLVALGVEKDKELRGPWSKERILEMAKQIFAHEGKISNYYLQKTKRSSLGSAITRFYPGGWKQLRVDLKIQQSEVNISKEQANTDLDNLFEEESNG